MADYWKSGERHYCKFCNCWLAGNKVSINFHESGNRHKAMVKAKLDQIRKTNVEKERQEKHLSATLNEMERAANESFRRDAASNSANASNYDAATPSPSSDPNLSSKLKRPASQSIQIQCKKPKFVIKTPTQKPEFELISKTTEKDVKTVEEIHQSEGTWYESKTETQESYYWNDVTGESTWKPPVVYLSIEQQRAKGLNV